jgi:hypothetical protein
MLYHFKVQTIQYGSYVFIYIAVQLKIATEMHTSRQIRAAIIFPSCFCVKIAVSIRLYAVLVSKQIGNTIILYYSTGGDIPPWEVRLPPQRNKRDKVVEFT